MAKPQSLKALLEEAQLSGLADAIAELLADGKTPEQAAKILGVEGSYREWKLRDIIKVAMNVGGSENASEPAKLAKQAKLLSVKSPKADNLDRLDSAIEGIPTKTTKSTGAALIEALIGKGKLDPDEVPSTKRLSVEEQQARIAQEVPEAMVPDVEEAKPRGRGGVPKEPKKVPLDQLLKQFEKAGGKVSPEMRRDAKVEAQLKIAEQMEAQGLKVPAESIVDDLDGAEAPKAEQPAVKAVDPTKVKDRADKKQLGGVLNSLKAGGAKADVRRAIAALPPDVQAKFTSLPPESQKLVVQAAQGLGAKGTGTEGVTKLLSTMETGAAQKPGFLARTLGSLTGADMLNKLGPTDAYKTEKALADTATAAGQKLKGVTGKGAALARGGRELLRGKNLGAMAVLALMGKGFLSERAATKEVTEQGVVPSTGRPLRTADDLLREADMERKVTQRKMQLQRDPEMLGDVVRVLSGGDAKRITPTEVRIGNIPKKLKPAELNNMLDQFIRGLNDFDNIPSE